MIVSQILNNHVGVVKRGGNEVIVYSKGLAFCKKVGDRIENHEIQKLYVLDSHEKLEHFSYLLSNTKEEYLQIVNETIAYGEKVIQEKVSDYLYLALLDHINFAIKRFEKDQIIKSPLAWEVKKFYPEHYKIGLYTVERINQILQKDFPSEEAVLIALHFITLQTNEGNVNNMTKVMDAVKDILAIIKYHYGLEIKEDSVNYMRLVTHLQYFVVRIIKKEIFNSEESELNKQICKLYPEAFQCVNKIRKYVETVFDDGISSDEETYLILHIHRVTVYEGKED